MRADFFHLVGVCWALWPYPVVSLIHACRIYFFSWCVLGFVAIPGRQSDTCLQIIFFSWCVLGFVAIPGRQSDTVLQTKRVDSENFWGNFNINTIISGKVRS